MEVHVWLSDNVSQRHAIDSIEPIIVAMRWAAASNLRPVGLKAGNRGIVLELSTAIIVVFGLDRYRASGCKRIKYPSVCGPFASGVLHNNLAVVNSVGRESAVEANGEICGRRTEERILHFGE